jgi:O-antigen/teichoic acid export membrane protein
VRRGGLRDSTALATGSATSGVLAYLFFSVATHTLGSKAAAPVSVLWTYWSAATAVLTFPLQHWISRTSAVDAGEGGVRRALPGLSAVVVGCGVVVTTLAWALRHPLFHRGDLLFPALIGGVTIGSGFVGLVRGTLTARQRFQAVALALAGENALRCVAAGALAAAGVHNAAAYGLALVFGPLAGLCGPRALRPRPGGERVASESPLAFLGGVAGGSLIGQVVLTGGPVLLALLGGGPTQVTALFAALALFRAPYTLSLGLVAQVTGRLTVLVSEGRHDVLRRIRRAITAGTLVTALAGGAVGGPVGPVLVRIVFGNDVRISGWSCAAIAFGSVFAISNLVMTLSLIARGRGGAVLRSWVVGSAVGALCLLVTAQSAERRTIAVFVVAEVAAFLAMLVDDVRAVSPDRRGDTSAATTDVAGTPFVG